MSAILILLVVCAFPGPEGPGLNEYGPELHEYDAPGVQTPELLFDQGKRQFEALQYEQAIPLLDSVIAALTAGGQVQKPDLLVQAYELRARSRFATGDPNGTERDFSAILLIKPSYKPVGNISPTVVAIFEGVRKVTIGQVTISLTPSGTAEIDGQPYSLVAAPQTLDLPAGERQLKVVRPGYRTIDQKFTVVAGQVTPLAFELERVSSTLLVESIPADVEVVFDDAPRGRTAPGAGETSAPFLLGDLEPGNHRLLLRRDCHQSVERTITIDRPGDFKTDPIRLVPAVATVTIRATDAGARLFVDGVERGPVTAQPITMCEGLHVIDVRGPGGRFIDRRAWKTGETVTITAELRRAFPIVTARGGSVVSAEQLRTNVERALEGSKRVLVYAPVESDLAAAMSNEAMPADWLVTDIAAPARVPKDITRELGRRLTGKLQAQGIAAVTGGSDAYLISIALLAPGSGEPDVITINLADPASRTRALAALDAPLPPLVRASLETSFIDVAGVPGAVVIRANGVGAKAGLVAGDVIVSAGGAAVTSVADLQARIAAVRPPATDLALEVKSLSGATRSVTVAVTLVPETLPQRDPAIMYNRALIDLQDALRVGGATPVTVAAQRLNLAIVQMRLGNWEEALAALSQTSLPDGPGVSAGTVAYFTGICHEQTGRVLEAQTAFTKAAAAAQARLWHDGPLVAPLARQKLQGRR